MHTGVDQDGPVIPIAGGGTGAITASAAGAAIAVGVIASLPAHYQRDIVWSSNRTTIISPNNFTVNINNSGYILTAQQTINLATAASWDSIATNYTVAANRAGKDFYIYACQPNSGSAPVIVLSANSTVPTGYTATNSRKVGGFHCLCAAVGAISGHPLSGYVMGDILPTSIWDLNFRPVSQPEGMVYSSQLNLWIDIYLQSGTGASTKSVYGAVTTDTRIWNDHVDDLAAVSKKLLDDTEFQIAAEGSNQQTNIAGSSDANTTGGHSNTAGVRMISNIGCEDFCGFLWQWLRDQSTRWDGSGGWNWRGNIGSKGQLYIGGDANDVKLLAGGNWSSGGDCGSRSRKTDSCRWNASADIGARGRAEPLRWF
jgi:hypothetical protein